MFGLSITFAADGSISTFSSSSISSFTFDGGDDEAKVVVGRRGFDIFYHTLEEIETENTIIIVDRRNDRMKKLNEQTTKTQYLPYNLLSGSSIVSANTEIAIQTTCNLIYTHGELHRSLFPLGAANPSC